MEDDPTSSVKIASSIRKLETLMDNELGTLEVDRRTWNGLKSACSKVTPSLSPIAAFSLDESSRTSESHRSSRTSDSDKLRRWTHLLDQSKSLREVGQADTLDEVEEKEKNGLLEKEGSVPTHDDSSIEEASYNDQSGGNIDFDASNPSMMSTYSSDDYATTDGSSSESDDEDFETYENMEHDIEKLEKQEREAEERGDEEEIRRLKRIMSLKQKLLDGRKRALDLLKLAAAPSSPKSPRKMLDGDRKEFKSYDKLEHDLEKLEKEEQEAENQGDKAEAARLKEQREAIQNTVDCRKSALDILHLVDEAPPSPRSRGGSFRSPAGSPRSPRRPVSMTMVDLREDMAPPDLHRRPASMMLSLPFDEGLKHYVGEEPKKEETQVEAGEKNGEHKEGPICVDDYISSEDGSFVDVEKATPESPAKSRVSAGDTADTASYVDSGAPDLRTMEEKQKQRKLYMILGAFVAVVAIVVLSVVVATKEKSTLIETPTTPAIPPSGDEPATSPVAPVPTTLDPTEPLYRLQLLTNIVGSYFPENPKGFASTENGKAAMEWLAYNDPAELHMETEPYIVMQRYCLALLYINTRGIEWLQQIDGDEEDTCNWERLLCSVPGARGQVEEINLCKYCQ